MLDSLRNLSSINYTDKECRFNKSKNMHRYCIIPRETMANVSFVQAGIDNASIYGYRFGLELNASNNLHIESMICLFVWGVIGHPNSFCV